MRAPLAAGSSVTHGRSRSGNRARRFGARGAALTGMAPVRAAPAPCGYFAGSCARCEALSSLPEIPAASPRSCAAARQARVSCNASVRFVKALSCFPPSFAGRAHRGLDAQEGCAFGGGSHRMAVTSVEEWRAALTCGHEAAEGARDEDQKAVTGKDGRRGKIMTVMKTRRAES